MGTNSKENVGLWCACLCNLISSPIDFRYKFLGYSGFNFKVTHPLGVITTKLEQHCLWWLFRIPYRTYLKVVDLVLTQLEWLLSFSAYHNINILRKPHLMVLHLFTFTWFHLLKFLVVTPINKIPLLFIEGSKWDNRSHSRHRRKCLLDCFGGQLDANTRLSTGYAQNLPDNWD
jgi:hypothetical protein